MTTNHRYSDIAERWLTVWDFRRITLTHNSTDFGWMLSVPATAQHLLMGTSTDSGFFEPAINTLASSTLARLSSNPLILDRIIGPDIAVEAFTETWQALLLEQGIRVRIHPGTGIAFNGSRVSYATRASLPRAPSTPFPHPIMQARIEDVDTIAQLYIAFQLDDPWRRVVTHDAALGSVAGPVAAGLVWFVRINSEPAGYVMLGRTTPRTIAIRNVFVSSPHRRKGIAEAMVRGVTRYYLNAPPYGVEPILDGPPAVGFKEEVHLNVWEESAERVYKRAGFLFPDRSGDIVVGGVDPTTSRKSWFTLARREIERESQPSIETQAL